MDKSPNFVLITDGLIFYSCSQSRMEYEERVKKQAKEMTVNGN